MKLTYDDILIVPKHSYIKSRMEINVRDHNGKLPVMVSPMNNIQQDEILLSKYNDAGFIVCLHRFMTHKERMTMLEKLNKMTDVSQFYISFGIKDFFENKGQYIADIKDVLEFSGNILIDVANGHNAHVHTVIDCIKSIPGVINIIGGNVATNNGARQLNNVGANIIRVGIGNGSACTTRLMTGVGYPQFSALHDIRDNYLSRAPFTMVADGGVNHIGDIAKALIYANFVMTGRLFAQTKEVQEFTAGKYFGMASHTAKLARGEDGHVEGGETQVERLYSVKELAETIEQSLRSTLSYVGATNLSEYRNLVEWIQISPATHIENRVR